MNKREFIKQRKSAWQRFEYLVDRLDRIKFSKMRAQEISEFSRLFRELSNDLAIIRSRAWGRSLVSYLNHLVARGHNSFYSAPPGNLNEVLRFLSGGFPRLLRANLGYFLAASVLFFLPLAIAWPVVQNDPSLIHRILSPRQFEGLEMNWGKKPIASESSDQPDDGVKQGAGDADDSLTDDSYDDREWDGRFGEGRAGMFGFTMSLSRSYRGQTWRQEPP